MLSAICNDYAKMGPLRHPSLVVFGKKRFSGSSGGLRRGLFAVSPGLTGESPEIVGHPRAQLLGFGQRALGRRLDPSRVGGGVTQAKISFTSDTTRVIRQCIADLAYVVDNRSSRTQSTSEMSICWCL